jgi:cytochrome c oxidase assembly protein subunit 15
MVGLPEQRAGGDLCVGRTTRRLLVANVAAQVGIVVTGGLVRLTGSGLGCPTWPECTDGSLVPTSGQAEGTQSLVEFGNRLLTVVLVVVAVAALVAVVRQRPRRRPLVTLAALVLAGIPAQAVLGGFTVLVDLHPAAVAAHFLLSMAVIAAAVVLLRRATEAGDGPALPTVRGELRVLSGVIAVVALVVLALGTVVTGSGPHAGDEASPRFGFDPRAVSWLHADLVIVFVGLALAFWLGCRLSGAPARSRRAAGWLLVAILAQGAVGYAQYFSGVPVALVAVHVLGACLVWVAALTVELSTRERLPAQEQVT